MAALAELLEAPRAARPAASGHPLASSPPLPHDQQKALAGATGKLEASSKKRRRGPRTGRTRADLRPIGDWLRRPEFAPLARQLNFVVIRGTYAEFHGHSQPAIPEPGPQPPAAPDRRLAAFAGREHHLGVPVPGPEPLAILPGNRPAAGSFCHQKLFGPERFRLRLGSSRLAVPPTSFSQVNESILPLLLDQVRSLLAREGRERLLDLYCGYGLFSFHLRQDYREIVAIDASAASIRAARDLVPLNPGRARLLFKT